MSIVLGDLNVVRSENERLGSLFCKSGARHFNEFISNSELVDLPMGESSLVISHIFNFHKQKFEVASTNRPHFSSNLFETLSEYDISILDAPFSCEEIKEAIWNCGGSKGPDGFTFKFIKHHWDILCSDFINMVKRFEIDGHIPKGCNSSFIALVPKKDDPLDINDFRPISLIGCQYQVITKVLANRIIQVVHSVISEVQMAYINGRQIIDGPLMVIEIISWASKKKEHLFILKVNFEKAFDSLDWNFLHNIMSQIGLKVNFNKSKFFGVGVGSMKTLTFASILNLQPSTLPCTYLGLPIGSNMSKGCNWKPIIDKFHNKLTSWKARTLSYGGILTLLKSVLGALVLWDQLALTEPATLSSFDPYIKWRESQLSELLAEEICLKSLDDQKIVTQQCSFVFAALQWFSNGIKKKPIADDECAYCKQKGHWKSECPFKPKQPPHLNNGVDAPSLDPSMIEQFQKYLSLQNHAMTSSVDKCLLTSSQAANTESDWDMP
ncbi:RNA-directed DNA polymerase, eukaryota, reverse transcriptase zinc-binding domain protein [Tanacetum coccineum]